MLTGIAPTGERICAARECIISKVLCNICGLWFGGKLLILSIPISHEPDHAPSAAAAFTGINALATGGQFFYQSTNPNTQPQIT
jgi:hypothetical protein